MKLNLETKTKEQELILEYIHHTSFTGKSEKACKLTKKFMSQMRSLDFIQNECP